MLKEIYGNLLEAKEKYIVHQLNCITTGAGGLAYHLFEKYPYADVYKTRLDSVPNRIDTPGDIVICGNGSDERYVIGIFGQYYPGNPRNINGITTTQLRIEDTEELRKEWFFQGLKKIKQIPNLESIAFPFKIGCGLGGGDWDFYYRLLKKFSKAIPDVDMVIYEWEES